MKKIFYTLICIQFSVSFQAQNLVQNGSFETISSCPTAEGQLAKAAPWTSARGTCDLYNTCSSSSSDVPSNTAGYQNARTGNSYAGFFATQGMYFEEYKVREYLHAPLISPLQAGETYCVSFYLSFADKLDSFDEVMFDVAVNNLGAYFSSTGFTPDPWNFDFINVIPQVLNDPNNQLLTDTLNWMLVEGQFVANGGEQYITIGSFTDNAGQDTTAMDFWQFNQWSYYFIDDISVKNCNCPPIDLVANVLDLACHNAANAEITVLANGGTSPYSYFLSQGTDTIQTQLDLQDSARFQNLAAGNYMVSILDSNNCESELPIIISNPAPISINASIQSDSCDLGLGKIEPVVSGGTGNYHYSWSNGSTENHLVNIPSGTYVLQVSDENNCILDTVFVVDGTHAPIAGVSFLPGLPAFNGVPVVFSDSSIPNADSLISYTWNFAHSNFEGQPEVETTFYIQDENFLEYIVVNSDGCSDTLNFPIDVYSDLIVPNVVVLNSQSMNETFTIHGIEAYKTVSLAVFNRWGNSIYEIENYNNDWSPKDLTDGTYFYKLSLKDSKGKESTQQGFFQIIH